MTAGLLNYFTPLFFEAYYLKIMYLIGSVKDIALISTN